jgi:hypothetical protein
VTVNATNVTPTLDGLFRRVLARQPDAAALLDPLNKRRVTGQPPRRLTFAQADRAIGALAAHFIEAGLPVNSVIAVQLPNTVEFMLTVLAAHRAGLVVALLPQLWRQAELTVALNRSGARAIVTCGKIDGVDHADLAMNAAVEAFSIRHVCGFGNDLPEGMASLDVVLDSAAGGETATTRAVIQDGRKAAIISFDVTVDGFRAVPRTHLNLIAGGLGLFLESDVPRGATVMSAFAPSSFAGLASSLLIWLLSGGTLALHHPFDGDVLAQQINDDGCDTLIAPAQLALRLAETELPTLRKVIGLWRAPEQVASSMLWTNPQATLTDVYLFGEAGLFAACRAADGAPVAILPGPHGAPRDIESSPIAGEILLTPRGTLALRGPMVAAAAYASGPAGSDPPRDHVDTDYAARLDRSTGAICITAPPAGIMAVGGYRFLSQDLQEWAKRLGQGALLTALPDRLSGYRLAGRGQDNARAREALAELGLNPLMVEAFRDPAHSA